MEDAYKYADKVLTMDRLGRHRSGAEHRRARRLFIKSIQQAELAHEKALLDDIRIPGNRIPVSHTGDWHGHDFYGVTDRLLTICRGNASTRVRREVENRHGDGTWLRKTYTGAPEDQAEYLRVFGGSDYRSEPLKRIGNMLKDALKAPSVPGMNLTNRILMRRHVLADLLHKARRFTDTRNPETKQRALPDGSNLENDDLRISWITHRAWIRLLRYRSLRLGKELFGQVQLLDLLESSVYQYFKVESTNYSPDYWSESDVLEFGLGRMLCALQKKLGVVADGLVGQEGNNSVKTLLLVETDDLYGDLLALGCAFEAQDLVEHIEDTLVDRRIVEADDWTEVHEILRTDRRYSPRYLERSVRPTAPTENMRNTLSRTMEVNQLRRNYRLLRDWSAKRPWKQLYYVFDTSDDRDHRQYRQPIADFHLKIKHLQESPDPNLATDSPSQKANIFSHLFLIHPIATTDPHVRYFDSETGGSCIICMEVYKPHDVLVALPCDHLFHFSCVRENWDTETLYAKKCVICRQIAPSLHSIAGITPEVMDVWDSVAVNGIHNLFFPDIPNEDTIYFYDDELLEASEDWDNPRSLNYGRSRSAWTEMSVLRDRRQKENVRRRARVKGTGPKFPPNYVSVPEPHLAGGAAISAAYAATGKYVAPDFYLGDVEND